MTHPLPGRHFVVLRLLTRLVRCVHSPGEVCCADYRGLVRRLPRCVAPTTEHRPGTAEVTSPHFVVISTSLRRYPHPTSVHLSGDFGVAFGQHRGVCRRLPRICPRGTEVPFAET